MGADVRVDCPARGPTVAVVPWCRHASCGSPPKRWAGSTCWTLGGQQFLPAGGQLELHIESRATSSRNVVDVLCCLGRSARHRPAHRGARFASVEHTLWDMLLCPHGTPSPSRPRVWDPAIRATGRRGFGGAVPWTSGTPSTS